MRRRLSTFAACSAAALAAGLATPTAAETARDNLPQVYSMTPTGVNLQSGTFIRTETDFSIGSLAFERSRRAISTFTPVTSGNFYIFGGWDHNYGWGAKWHEGTSDGVNVYADGKIYQFRVNASGYWSPWNIDQFNNNAYGASLTGTVGSNLVFTNQAGDVFTMNAGNQAIRVERADGTRLDLSYDATKRLRTVLSNRGEAIVLDYNASGLLVAACGYNRATTFVGLSTTCAAAPVKASYGYTATSAAQGWVLSSVTGADGAVTSMSYDTYFKPNLLCITVPNTQTCQVTNVYGPQPGESTVYTLPDQVRRQTLATGEVYQFYYQNLNLYEMPRQPNETYYSNATMTDPLGRETYAEYENGLLKSLWEPQGVTSYAWNGIWPTTFSNPGGNVEVLGYDNRGNVISHRRSAAGVPDLIRTWQHPPFTDPATGYSVDCSNPKLCNKPVYETDPKNNRTDFVRDPAHGGVISETGPAVMSNGVMARPQKRYLYEQRFAGVKDSAGAIVPAAAPVWLLVEERECMTVGSTPNAPSPCANTADEVRIVYEYGPSGTANALRPRGKVVDPGGLNLRTCTAYDDLGNSIGATSPKGTTALSACP